MTDKNFPVYDPQTGEMFMGESGMSKPGSTQTSTETLAEIQALTADLEYCQERAALMRDTLEVLNRSELVLTVFDKMLFRYISVLCGDIIEVGEQSAIPL
jgi:hypothetical protein